LFVVPVFNWLHWTLFFYYRIYEVNGNIDWINGWWRLSYIGFECSKEEIMILLNKLYCICYCWKVMYYGLICMMCNDLLYFSSLYSMTNLNNAMGVQSLWNCFMFMVVSKSIIVFIYQCKLSSHKIQCWL
jgi:hypothetical protein